MGAIPIELMGTIPIGEVGKFTLTIGQVDAIGQMRHAWQRNQIPENQDGYVRWRGDLRISFFAFPVVC